VVATVGPGCEIHHFLAVGFAEPALPASYLTIFRYPDFLKFVSTALRRHRIGFTSFNDRRGIENFKEDPGVECFLLHARAHSSGLNLVNASHVILCEPLLNTALELQAIARVDRIGQQHETTVWLYLVDGTVEESIYNLSVQRRLEHMGRNLKGKSKESTPEILDTNLEVANALEMEHAQLSKLMRKGQAAGEEIAKGDLWSCLFGNKDRPSRDTGYELSRNEPEVRRYLAADAAEERRIVG
jgi:E3 ubiquitin-protein ligase SHPRH